jgi:riboflavin biosynthesis pyrimidine reductase
MGEPRAPAGTLDRMRLLYQQVGGRHDSTEVGDEELRRLYAFPDRPWLRANFVATLDGRATGPDGQTGTINPPADNEVFALQRRLCDAVVVGAGTARAEGYEQVREDGSTPLLAIVSNRCLVPKGFHRPQAGAGVAVMITCAAAEESAVEQARNLLGPEAVWALGQNVVDLPAARARLHAEGYAALLCEGGPTLFASLLSAGLVDELALTWAPKVLAGDGVRITRGPQIDSSWQLRLLLEEDSTLLGLWRATT